MARKPWTPKPGGVGAAITWTQHHADGSTTERTGTIVGRAPSLGLGHKAEKWVVADEPLATDPYDGGVVVAEKAKTGYAWSTPRAAVTGAAFSDDDTGSPTGGIGYANAQRTSRAAYALVA